MKRLTIPTFLMAGALLFNACSEGGSPTDVNLRDTSPQFAHGDGGWSGVVEHRHPDGNPSCSDLGYSHETKVEPITAGETNTLNGFSAVVSTNGIYITSWSAPVPVDAVIVKGGPNANEYQYDPAATSDVADPGLHSPPLTANGTDYPGVSHISFCYTPKLTITKTATTSYNREWTWDIEKDLQVVDPPLSFGEGDLLTVNYKVTLSATSEDVDHNVSGTITIHNPAAYNTAANITSVTDVLTPGPLAATVNCPGGLPQALASGGTLECTYSRDVDNTDTDLNTATVVSTGVPGGTATAAVVWGANPTNEIDECVDVSDLLTINGIDEPSEYLGEVCAPDDLTDGEYLFEYTRTFGAGGEFPLACDNNTVDNVASFITNDTDTEGEDDAGFQIFVTCEEPGDPETAWAANGNTPGQLPYTTRGNWATYVEYFGVAKVTTMFAGQTIDVGTASFSAPDVNNEVTILITLTGGWEFEPGSVVAVQDYLTAPSGNPSPGTFDHKADPTTATTATIKVPNNKYYGVHAVVVP
jgi:hypothetical protein